MKRIAYIVATGLGSGYSPFAPGTAGTLCFIILGGWFVPAISLQFQLLIAGIFFIVSVYSSNIVEADLIDRLGEEKGHDAGMIVIDEVLGMAIALIAIPNTWYAIFAAFILFRIFDITKPFPINRLQNLPRGWGITIDDVVAGVYANILVQCLRFIQFN